MPIPDYESIMLPLLKFACDKKEHSLSETIDHANKFFGLTEEERRQLLPSGMQRIVDNRVGWARTYMKKAKLLESTRRGYFRITDRGLEILKQNPSEINVKFLMQFPEFVQFQTVKKDAKKDHSQKTIVESLDPIETLENSFKRIQNDLAEDLLNEVKKSSPTFFEKTVLELLRKMGYGGYLEGSGEHTGRAGDEGIDGKIKEDRLGLDVVYIQAKKWQGSVGRPEIHKFVGALKGQGANKGIFITTSAFSNEALDYASKIDSPKIVLMDGITLAQLMIEYDIGVSKVKNYEIKRKDSDFFIGD